MKNCKVEMYNEFTHTIVMRMWYFLTQSLVSFKVWSLLFTPWSLSKMQAQKEQRENKSFENPGMLGHVLYLARRNNRP